MGYWASKVLPKIKKVFESSSSSSKKAAAAQACKGFDDSKEEFSKVCEEKKLELQSRVLEIYQASSAEIKTLVKERTVDGVNKNAAAVNTFLEELVKIEFPGAKAASEASAKFGPALVPGPVFFVFEKVTALLPAEEPKAAEPVAVEEAPEAVAAGGSSSTEKEVEEEKEKAAEEEEKAPVAAPEVTPGMTTTSEAPSAAAAVEAAKLEEAPKA